jgi:hypothetical protein
MLLRKQTLPIRPDPFFKPSNQIFKSDGQYYIQVVFREVDLLALILVLIRQRVSGKEIESKIADFIAWLKPNLKMQNLTAKERAGKLAFEFKREEEPNGILCLFPLQFDERQTRKELANSFFKTFDKNLSGINFEALADQFEKVLSLQKSVVHSKKTKKQNLLLVVSEERIQL